MTTETVEMILNKLGTTIDNLVPATIDYMHHGTLVDLWIGVALLIFSIVCGVLLVLVQHSKISYDTADSISLVLGCLGIPAFIIGIVMTIFSSVSLHLWNAYPTIRAYEAILGWLK